MSTNKEQAGGEHTPTPWRRHQVEHDSIVEASTGHAIALVMGRRFSDETNAANLAFIVEAVNSHAASKARIAELEGALDKLVAWADTMLVAHQHPFLNSNIVHEARALLQPSPK